MSTSLAIPSDDSMALLAEAFRLYGHLIGITKGGFPEEMVRALQEQFPALLKKSGCGAPLFVDDDCVWFMHMQTGLPLGECATFVYTDCADMVEEGISPPSLLASCYAWAVKVTKEGQPHLCMNCGVNLGERTPGLCQGCYDPDGIPVDPEVVKKRLQALGVMKK